MARKFHIDGCCSCCGRVGPTHEDLDSPAPARPPLCDTCDYAQTRWEAWQVRYTSPVGYPHLEPPPKSPPVRRSAA